MAREPTAIEGHEQAIARRAVLIVDDHPLYRGGLRSALAPLAVAIGEAATLLDALDALGAHRFDLILYDWHLPDGGGCKGLVAIRQLAPGVPVVVISADEDETIAFAAGKIGVAACLSKATSAKILQQILDPLLGAAPAMAPPTDAASAATAASAWPSAVARSLTRRQHEVLQLMARGETNKCIAERLGIARTTVRSHVSDLLQLLHARNRTEAVVFAQREGLVSPAYHLPTATAAPSSAPAS